MPAAITSLGKLVIANDTAFSAGLLRLDFHDFDHGVTLELKDLNSTRGRLDRDDARVRQNRTVVAPRIRCQPTAVELAAILAWATGGTPSGSGTVTYPLGNTAVARSLWYLPSNGTGWQLQNCGEDGYFAIGRRVHGLLNSTASTKSQAPEKHQDPTPKGRDWLGTRRMRLLCDHVEAWILELLWVLVFGPWCLFMER